MARLYGDKRMVNPDLNDVIDRLLILFVCRADTLAVLESLPMVVKEEFVKRLLTPIKEGCDAILCC